MSDMKSVRALCASVTKEMGDYAAARTEEILSQFDGESEAIPHQAWLQAAIRQAILEAMRDQRYSCIAEFQRIPFAALPDVGLRAQIETLIHNATVKPQEKK